MAIKNLFEQLEEMGASLPGQERKAPCGEEAPDPETILREKQLAMLVAQQMGLPLEDLEAGEDD